MNGSPNEYILLGLTPEQYRLVIHALMTVTPTGGGSPIHSCYQELIGQVDMEIDYDLIGKMSGTVIRESFEALEQRPPKIPGVLYAHPYDIK